MKTKARALKASDILTATEVVPMPFFCELIPIAMKIEMKRKPQSKIQGVSPDAMSPETEGVCSLIKLPQAKAVK
jgi:hypothetical protein